ncbi:hypothetical protein KFL_000130130 [Klebsormidium nitens]|uniref:Uncharacterized protein n=1 Tax=Klebsormidium nitens TaxID=105231 RepID=A0A1Y1HN68_KLENI|nr:hypothetical protein KFL_000130130 [Klebsormidium nitens]|eukprot:GAQ78431.1 hypothetical protein KFL_000130130 [Klebsormidium nitens]
MQSSAAHGLAKLAPQRAEEGVVQTGFDTWPEEDDETFDVSRPTGSRTRGFASPQKTRFAAVPLEDNEISSENWLEKCRSASRQGELMRSRSSSFDSHSHPVGSPTNLEYWGDELGFAPGEETPDVTGSRESFWTDTKVEDEEATWKEEAPARGKERQWLRRRLPGGKSVKIALADGGGKYASVEKAEGRVVQSIIRFGKKPTLMLVYARLMALEPVN